ncbi:hypothetical protein [Parathalassolituus penaei]|uniref:Uncharacterized protein n=1 Tax=Parathalassolituus penaei TaxID=2997323 RepID=A0A9X3IVE0_9GAMM|nr:hypothetical protein [Parathalassolituus penaei]MCY0967163.1 hypothetical protein [Parathalassolituus penaei]
MEAQKPSRNRKKRPFKQTKELVRLALNDGWTQADIATSCRTQQSIVSDWKKGTKTGTEEQLRPLLEVFGSKLRRASFRFYRAVSGALEGGIWHKVEGQVILQRIVYCQDPQQAKWEPLYKLVVHALGRGKFNALYLSPVSLDKVACGKDENWLICYARMDLDVTKLLGFIDNPDVKPRTPSPLDGEVQIKYLVRAALLNHGYPVDDVVTHPANW